MKIQDQTIRVEDHDYRFGGGEIVFNYNGVYDKNVKNSEVFEKIFRNNV